MVSPYSLPDSPAEPDLENQQGTSDEPKLIPHDEVLSSLLQIILSYY